MSHIPNSAMPHAGPAHEPEVAPRNDVWRGRAAKVAERVREHPGPAIAAGAAVLAGAVAAAAVPLIRSRRAPAKKKPAARAKKG